MAVRTTAEAVRLVWATRLTDDEIEQYISDASAWIDENVVGHCDLLPVDDASEPVWEIIERYLAIAFITEGRQKVLTSARRQDIAETYATRDPKAGSYWFTLAAGYEPCGIIKVAFLGQRRAFADVGIGFVGEAESSES
jgi:hypothetical protein